MTDAELDAFFMSDGHEVHPLEAAARICMAEASRGRTWQSALIAERCAIEIRRLPEWQAYRKVPENQKP